jgi:hypothetical protein
LNREFKSSIIDEARSENLPEKGCTRKSNKTNKFISEIDEEKSKKISK